MSAWYRRSISSRAAELNSRAGPERGPRSLISACSSWPRPLQKRSKSAPKASSYHLFIIFLLSFNSWFNFLAFDFPASVSGPPESSISSSNGPKGRCHMPLLIFYLLFLFCPLTDLFGLQISILACSN